MLAAHEHLKTEDGRRRLVRHGHGPERAILTGIGPVRRVSLTRHGQRVLENAGPLWATAQNHLVEGLGHRRWSELLANLSDTVALLRDR